ncbi:DUF1801 domain-containing protein [Roseateles toxinivorans]|uniref:Uncharacterized protein DUF1801 n=1 Tax=Roseateles toxinivorans TaxID=270368 RepID=A0A4R6QJR0_9BURK|nr:DUF1801 domain-containing protein [Roseateles toxinivorans]TDP62739.1 uncharacterized protein DUF1801 [Roseateles toxinivorans]
MTPFLNPGVEAKFAAYPRAAQKRLLELRELVFAVAERTPGVGELEETLKWGEPAYHTRNGAGSTVRMDWKPRHPDQYALYFNCQTTLVETFRTMFPNDFVFEGRRALVLPVNGAAPQDALALCIEASLTYHARKRAAKHRGQLTVGPSGRP